jgi:hypothetical protein
MNHPISFKLPVALFCILMASTVSAQAQQKPAEKDSAKEKKSHWVVGTTYQSDAVYLGRKDSVAIPYISPSIGYHDKSGFFITGSVSYLSGTGNNRIDVGTIEGGYSYSSDDFNAGISAAKDFYSDQSFAVTSEISGRLSASLSYDFGFVEPSIDLGMEFSGSPDIGLDLGLGHSFTIIEDRFEVDPAIHLNAATQNYYANYYNKRRYSAKRQGGTKTQNILASLANPSKFQIMDYEFEAPFEYTIKKKLKLNFTPTLAIPVNPSTITLSGKTSGNNAASQTVTENLSSTFYFSIGFTYTL